MTHKNTLDAVNQDDHQLMMEFVEPCVSIVTVDECHLTCGSQALVKIPPTAIT
jgi:hypothetical protein